MSRLTSPDPWDALRALTPARIAQGRSGDSQTTRALIDFQHAHAAARDAVHEPLRTGDLLEALESQGFARAIAVHSRARSRDDFLRHPDAGRRLEAEAVAQLSSVARPGGVDLAVVIGDGLSARAAHEHAVELLQQVRLLLGHLSWSPVVVAQQARVALGDEIGSCLGARLVAMILGERPGLSATDSLGIYLTFAPRVGRTDAQRNCLSNVRRDGLVPALAAQRLSGLVAGARRLGATGVALKDETPAPALAGKGGAPA